MSRGKRGRGGIYVRLSNPELQGGPARQVLDRSQHQVLANAVVLGKAVPLSWWQGESTITARVFPKQTTLHGGAEWLHGSDAETGGEVRVRLHDLLEIAGQPATFRSLEE